MLTAFLVDDMPQALQILQHDLADCCPDIQIIGTADSVVSAAKQLRSLKPDLLFLDIMLGDGTGFDLLEILPNLSSKVIFVTASDEHAIRAFRFAAIDYLLKPIDPVELKEAVQRARNQLTDPVESIDLLRETIHSPTTLPNRISLNTQERIVVVEIRNIIRCEADGNNTLFHLSNGERVFVTRTLKQFDNLLKEHPFFRTHQSHLVNLEHIQEYVRKEGGYLKMDNGNIVPVAVRKKAELVQLLSDLGGV